MKFIKCEERWKDLVINPQYLIRAYISPTFEEETLNQTKEFYVVGQMKIANDVVLFIGTYGECEEYLDHLCKMNF